MRIGILVLSLVTLAGAAHAEAPMPIAKAFKSGVVQAGANGRVRVAAPRNFTLYQPDSLRVGLDVVHGKLDKSTGKKIYNLTPAYWYGTGFGKKSFQVR